MAKKIFIRTEVGAGLGSGSLVALVMSFIVNKSVIWGLIHFMCSWLYVVWALAVHTKALSAWFDQFS